MWWYILLFLLIPAIEIGLFIWAGSKIGALAVVALILLTGVIGIAAVRQQGTEVMRRLQQAYDERRKPANELLDGVCIILGGILLVTPGFFTDILGFLIVLPWTRKPFKALLAYIMMKQIAKRNFMIRRF